MNTFQTANLLPIWRHICMLWQFYLASTLRIASHACQILARSTRLLPAFLTPPFSRQLSVLSPTLLFAISLRQLKNRFKFLPACFLIVCYHAMSFCTFGLLPSQNLPSAPTLSTPRSFFLQPKHFHQRVLDLRLVLLQVSFGQDIGNLVQHNDGVCFPQAPPALALLGSLFAFRIMLRSLRSLNQIIQASLRAVVPRNDP